MRERAEAPALTAREDHDKDARGVERCAEDSLTHRRGAYFIGRLWPEARAPNLNGQVQGL
jgi:hypothetical protein